jgi:hypothetical protein
MISPQSCPLLRTRLPSAPAALERVFSSSPLSSSTRGATAGRSASYKLGLWKAALPIAKHANFLQAQEQLRPVVYSSRYDRLTPAAQDV